MNVDEFIANSNLGDLSCAISLEVESRVSARSCALHVALKDFQACHRKDELVSLSRPTIHDQYRLVCIFVPREDFRGRVHECRTSDVVIADMRLGVTAIQCERSIAHLRNCDVSKGRGLYLELVSRRRAGGVVRMAQEVEACATAKCWSDSQSIRVRPLGGRCIAAACSQVSWADFEEVRLNLLLRVLLSINATILSDSCRVVV